MYLNSVSLAQYTDNGIKPGGLFDNFEVDIDKYKVIINQFSQLDLSAKKYKKGGKANWDAIAKSIKGCDETALSYFKTLEDGNGTINNQSASIDGLVKQLKAENKSAGLAAAKTTLLNTALNAGIFLVASLAIQGIANAFNNYIHRVENARKRTAELFDEFKEMNDTLADHKKTVAELADRYDELSKGVNLSNNKNISLSAADYEEFLNINEQLADSFPELTKGIDDNGNSILTLGTKGITAREQLEDLLKTEEDLNNFRIAQGLEDAFKGVYTYIEDADKAANTLMEEIAQTAANASFEVSHVADAINDIPESKDVTISVHTVGSVSGGASSQVSQTAFMEGNVYASGTRHAEKDLALVGEEKPEVIITNNKKAFLAKQPSLLHFGTSGIIAHYLKNHCKLHAYSDLFYRFYYFIKKQERLVEHCLIKSMEKSCLA